MPLPDPAIVSGFSTGVSLNPLVFSSSGPRWSLHSGAFQELPERPWLPFSEADLLEDMLDVVADYHITLELS